MKDQKQIPRVFHFVTEISIAWHNVTIIYLLTLSSLKYQCIGHLVHICDRPWENQEKGDDTGTLF